MSAFDVKDITASAREIGRGLAYRTTRNLKDSIFSTNADDNFKLGLNDMSKGFKFAGRSAINALKDAGSSTIDSIKNASKEMVDTAKEHPYISMAATAGVAAGLGALALRKHLIKKKNK